MNKFNTISLVFKIYRQNRLQFANLLVPWIPEPSTVNNKLKRRGNRISGFSFVIGAV